MAGTFAVHLFAEDMLEPLYSFLQNDAPESALVLFELNTAAFPDAFNVWDSLAEAHATLGNLEEAVLYYQVSLDLNPAGDNAREQIARLRGAN